MASITRGFRKWKLLERVSARIVLGSRIRTIKRDRGRGKDEEREERRKGGMEEERETS